MAKLDDGTDALTIDEVISVVRRWVWWDWLLERNLPGLAGLPAFRRVVSEYIRLAPAAADADAKTSALISCLAKLKDRVAVKVMLPIEWDKKWSAEKIRWTKKQAQLVKLLRDAADLFDSGQCDAGPYPSLAKYGEPDQEFWCGSHRLRAWAKNAESSPVDSVFPMVRPDLPGLSVSTQSIPQESGFAKSSDGAFSGMVVREIASFIPESVKDRSAAIAKLAIFIGHDVTRQSVAKILRSRKP